ncbi:MAG TPA: glycosyltransferase family 2 protein [Microthrixaceae bacterium]|nr:glycosyltransferase family 2 protein [Microthrixaceae bacterium]MCO5306100.1 glycosyltransferase family 2 protein [Microthrixaceae bacterium]HMY86566.1 glycosyltransferase family 2 protein [Microthrixaceae bacterium]HNE74414.1 glycosyltransferase family 2 protein [Microthrixaceae bacterium]HNJ69012.1 glycosyltransferase family 2 protein [Microthrixaceae bacterium]
MSPTAAVPSDARLIETGPGSVEDEGPPGVGDVDHGADDDGADDDSADDADDADDGADVDGVAETDPDDAEDDTDDAAEDAKWGLSDDAPIVGTGAPPVVAVMVTRDPGDWFEECLASIADQDYENLSLLVVDNGSVDDPTARVADVLPSAFVRRLPEDRGFAAAANEALVSVEGAPFLLFVHDDVRLRPDAVTAMVAEAFRANAGVVGAKLVDWDDEHVLRSVGLAVDVFGSSVPLVDPGELDQSQHDSARHVFAVSTACMLVRSDLFTTIDGFSAEIPFFGEDVDLCWRVHIAGASVQFCPRATVGHRERFSDRRPLEDRTRYETRHETRMVLANTELRRWWWTVPVGVVLGLVDLIGSALPGRLRHSGDVLAAGVWNLVHTPDLVRARARTRRARRVHDADYRTLFHKGSHRLRTLVRTDDGEGRLAAATRSGRVALADMTSVSSRAAAGLVIATVIVALVGARHLISGPLPVMRELVSGGSSATDLVSQWWTAWRGVGLGESSVPVGLVPAFGTVGTVLLGSIGLARRLLILAPLVIGAFGAWKMLSGTRSIRGRSAALAVYALNPIALNALATGRLQALVVYAAAPWLLRRVARQAGAAPFADPDRPPVSWPRHLAGNGLLLGTVAAVSPLGSLLLAVTVSVFGVAAVVGGERDRALRLPAAALGGLLFSLPLQLPWLVESITGGDAASLSGLWATRAALPSAAEMMTGSIGPIQTGWLGWGLVVAALVPLLTGRAWRLGWTVGAWTVILGSLALSVLLASSSLLGGAGVALFLMPTALGLSVAVAMAPLAFEDDVVSGDFGVGQLASAVGVVAMVIGLVPVLFAAPEGRWYLPEGDYQRALELVDRSDAGRTLWIGDPDVLPESGWRLNGPDDLAVGVTEGHLPTVTQRYRLDGGSGVEHLRAAVRAALDGRTSRVGQLLAPMGIRYVLLIDRPAPEPFSSLEVPLPHGAVAAFQEQLDLTRIPVAPGARLFEVAGAWPLRSDITELDLPANGVPTLAGQILRPMPRPPAVLGRGPGTSFSGELPDGADVAQAVTADEGWTLVTGSGTADRSGLFGWAQRFRVDEGGESTLSWNTPVAARLLQLIQVVGLVVLIAMVGRRRRLAAPRPRRRVRRGPAVVVVESDAAPESGPADRGAAAEERAVADHGEGAT